jgi:hypothetical protein
VQTTDTAGKEHKRWAECIVERRRIVYVIFLALAGLNGWFSYQMFHPHPLMDALNGAMAALLACWVIATW